MKDIRNFSIISHIDHGKTTLADRLLEITKTISEREMRSQFLDKMELERERGITIKLQPIRMRYKLPLHLQKTFNFSFLTFNLIDTPGHVDFAYEVSRSLAACEGAVLLVDAQKGIQAQTLANLRQAQKLNLKILPVVNKIDLENARTEEVANEIAELLKISKNEVLKISAKTGAGVALLLEKIVLNIPSPHGKQETPFKALIFDSYFDEYKGVVLYIRVVSGSVERGEKLKFFKMKSQAQAEEIGYFSRNLVVKDRLSAGEIGYIATGLKDPEKIRIGDTAYKEKQRIDEPLTGYEEIKPKVWASIFCIESEEFPKLKKAIEKLKLNDSSLNFQPENSNIFGPGFRCGFLGLLHLEITQDRLEREFNLDLVITAPSTIYQVKVQNKIFEITKPSELPEDVSEIRELWIDLEIISPSRYIGSLMELISLHRGVLKDSRYLDKNTVVLKSELPLAQIIVGFYDRLKSLSSGFASMNYKVIGYRKGELQKLELLIGDSKIDAFSQIISKKSAFAAAKNTVAKLKKLIPRQLFEVKIQANVGGKILASEKIPALRKDVIAKLYGGDRTRKDKLLKKQKAGKKKMKRLGSVDIPKDAFLKFLKI